MNTDLPAAIRECVDAGTQPISPGEVKARAALTERGARPVPGAPRRPVPGAPRRPVPARRGTLLAAAAGVAAAGIAAVLVATQAGGGTAGGTPAVLTAAMLKQVSTASMSALTSGRARIVTATGETTLVQDIKFDGVNWNDVLNPGVPIRIHRTPHLFSWTGQSIDRVVDGRAFHYPAFAFKPRPHLIPEWMRVIGPGVAAPVTIPDPRTLLSALSPSAGFVTDGYTIVNGVRAQRLRATTPAAVPLQPLNPLIATGPDNPAVSALSVWIDPSDVVLKARFTISGTGSPPAGKPEGSVTVTVTFSQIGQPQDITAPAHYITVGGKR